MELMSNAEIIRNLSRPLEPNSTEVEANYAPIGGIRAVLFDVYGTLFISASGDISLTSGASRGEAIGEALQAVGIDFTGNGDQAVELLHSEIKRRHAASRSDYPEVDIRDVWRSILSDFVQRNWISSQPDEAAIERLAIEYEGRVNPVWPMPGFEVCLNSLRQADALLGIVSNAQFFTQDLFPAFGGKTLRDLGFSPDLCVWSYEQLEAKPGGYLYRSAVAALAKRGINPSEVLYVGNDMRNDIAPAAEVGFRTVLYAGDKRSLRLREGDSLVGNRTADRVVTNLRQVLAILDLASADA